VDPNNTLSKRTSAASWAKSFWAGLTEPSALALGISLAVGASLTLTALWGAFSLNPRTMARGLPHWIGGPGLRDERCFINGEALALSEESEPLPDIILLGASSLRQASGDCSLLETELSQRLSHVVDVRTFAAGGVELAEIEALLLLVPKRFDGILVIGVSAQLFCMPSNSIQQIRERWAFPAATLRELAERRGEPAPELTGNYFLDNRNYFLVRAQNALFDLAAGKFPPRDRTYLMEPRPNRPADALDGFARQLMDERLSRYPVHSGARYEELERVIELSRRFDQAHVLLVHTPVNPVFVDQYAGVDFYRRHIDRLRAFAVEKQLSLIDLNEMCHFQASEFQDCTHLDQPEAIERCQHAIAEAIVRAGSGRLMARYRP
jgi:hypothetical protein